MRNKRRNQFGNRAAATAALLGLCAAGVIGVSVYAAQAVRTQSDPAAQDTVQNAAEQSGEPQEEERTLMVSDLSGQSADLDGAGETARTASGDDGIAAEEARETAQETGTAEARSGAASEDTASRGSFAGEAADQLLPEQKALLREYMERYYESLSELEPRELSDLFTQTEEAAQQVLMNGSAISYVTGLRAMQNTDLSLADYRYEMDVTQVSTAADGTVEISMTETSTQNFAQHPEVDTQLYNIRHYFVMRETEDGWRIEEHLQRDGFYWRLLGNYWNWEGRELDVPEPETYFAQRVDTLLEEARAGRDQRLEEVEESAVSAQHPYLRDEAVAYSDTWVGTRNTQWSDFTGRGGNCQNFVSQCLLAGGIPMDSQGAAVWSWNSEADSTTSWINVNEFYRYVRENEGYGLAASGDAPYYEGERGDLIRMGSEGNWNHIVIIAEVVRDEDGNTVDYLINSNTSDLKNFPVSAYPDPQQRLMKIYGWNEN
ncbi:MAG: amidase domain-containing protein [Eubacteriales bacterium]|nr:amidase domain-containing protein [Eubacteriales bacterium]